MVLLVSAVFATTYQGDRKSAYDAKYNVNEPKGIYEARIKHSEERIKHNINEPLSISDVELEPSKDNEPTRDEHCFDCEFDWSAYGAECCDAAWVDFGINCADLAANYNWDCAGCLCPGDAPPECGDGFCNGDETYETCPVDCNAPGECANGEVEDCDESGECWTEAWIGDGYCDGTAQQYGADLCCYDGDGGDCTEAECADSFCGDGACNGDETYETCPADCNAPGECEAGLVADCDGSDECWSDAWIGDGLCDGDSQEWGANLCCYDLDGGDCTEAECEGCANFTCWDGSCADSEADCPEIGDGMVVDCEGNVFDNTDPQYAGDGDSDGDGCLDTVYDCLVDNGTCEDIAGCCYDAAGIPTGEYTCPDGVIGSWTNDTLCDDGDFGLYANCLEMCFDGGACGTMPPDDCTIGDGGSGCETAGTGDVNADGATNVLDIVAIVNYILGSVEFDDCQFESADLNGDGAANVLDIVAIVNLILDGRSADASSARLINEAGMVRIDANGYVGAVQMTLTHGADFSINLTNDAMVAEYATKGNTTTLVVVAPEGDQLFTSNGEFEITEMIVANSSSAINVVMATEFSLMAAYPNPFNPSTTLSLNMPEDGFVSVKVFNLMGKTVATLAEQNMDANTYSFTWNASDMPSGLYMVRAEAMGHVSTQKLMLLK